MKRELVSIAIIVLMVFTVLGTTAVTATPTNTATNQNPIYMVTPGMPSVWISPFFNYQGPGTYASAPSVTATAHASGWGQLTTTVRAVASGTTGNSVCGDGVAWYLNPHVNWNAVKNEPVLVKALVSYKLSGSGSGAAGSLVELMGPNGNHQLIIAASGPPSYSVNQQPKMIEWKTTLGSLATQPGQGYLIVTAFGTVVGANGGITQSSTQVMVYSLALQWT